MCVVILPEPRRPSLAHRKGPPLGPGGLVFVHGLFGPPAGALQRGNSLRSRPFSTPSSDGAAARLPLGLLGSAPGALALVCPGRSRLAHCKCSPLASRGAAVWGLGAPRSERPGRAGPGRAGPARCEGRQREDASGVLIWPAGAPPADGRGRGGPALAPWSAVHPQRRMHLSRPNPGGAGGGRGAVASPACSVGRLGCAAARGSDAEAPVPTGSQNARHGRSPGGAALPGLPRRGRRAPCLRRGPRPPGAAGASTGA